MIPPMAAVAAMAEPVMAAKNMQARILTMASPLGKCPIRASAKSTIRLDMPPWTIKPPAKDKKQDGNQRNTVGSRKHPLGDDGQGITGRSHSVKGD